MSQSDQNPAVGEEGEAHVPQADAGVDLPPPALGQAESSEDPNALPPSPADGLELAKAFTRATASSSPLAKAKFKRRPQRRFDTKSSGSHPDDRDPQLLDMTLGRLVRDHGWGVDLKVHSLMARWGELVGSEIGDHTKPESFNDGILSVRTDSTAWATQLKLLAPTLVRRLNEELGNGTVLQIEVNGPVGPTWKTGRRSIRGARGPRDTYG